MNKLWFEIHHFLSEMKWQKKSHLLLLLLGFICFEIYASDRATTLSFDCRFIHLRAELGCYDLSVLQLCLHC